MTGARGERASEGELLAGTYALDERLGEGGMGEVYRARNTVTGRAVAIKRMLAEHATDATLKARFLTEARAANLVRHPNVVDVLDVGEDDRGVPFLVEELLEGTDLARHAVAQGGRLPPMEAVTLLLPIVDAVAFAHGKGVVHRDIKPENVFLAKVGDAIVPKLLDFGISRIATEGSTRLTTTGVGLGTPAYMAPEQIRSARHADARTDVWALGVLLFEVIAGDTPFPAETAAAMFVQISVAEPLRLEVARPDAPRALAAILARCLRKDPNERFASAKELGDALRAMLARDLAADDRVEEHDRPTMEAVAPPAPSDDFAADEAPSGLKLVTLRPTPATAPRRQIALAGPAPQPRGSQRSADASAFVGPIVLGGVVVVTCVALTIGSPVPQGFVHDVVAPAFEALPNGARFGVAALAIALAAAAAYAGARTAPRSIGHLVASLGLLVLGGLVCGDTIVADAAPPIAFALSAALVPTGATIALLGKASRAWRGEGRGEGGARAVGLVLAVLAALALFVAALLLRAGA